MGDDPIFSEIDAFAILLAHMVIADEVIDSFELDSLYDLVSGIGASGDAQCQIAAVFSCGEEAPTLQSVIKRISAPDRMAALEGLAVVAAADGVVVDSERKFIKTVARSWRVSAKTVDALLSDKKAAAEEKINRGQTDEPDPELSLGARLLQLLGRDIGDVVGQLAGVVNLDEPVRRAQREALLAGPEYDEAIARCAAVAREDFPFAAEGLESGVRALESLVRTVHKAIEGLESKRPKQQIKAEMHAEALELLKTIDIDDQAMQRLINLQRSLQSRKRSLEWFTIAFMGRTKAGKSTIHAVLTDENWEAIGKGAQRTTRFNRRYRWNRLAIIDTPGIGAPGGRTDCEVAESVIAEADLVCYVVTNDSQQATEFAFLDLLRENAKPLVVLLNLRRNLRNPKRLQRFLEHPGRHFAEDGPSGIKGHRNRIKRHAREHYGHDRFEIVPVQLLAAQMSREPEHANEADRLFEASRLEDLLSTIRVGVLDFGKIRRSHTLLGGTAADLAYTANWLSEKHKSLTQYRDMIASNWHELDRQIDNASQDAQDILEFGISEAFNSVRMGLPDFASTHWNSDQDALDYAWKRFLRDRRLKKGIKAAGDAAVGSFKAELKAIMDEIGTDMEQLVALGTIARGATEQDHGIWGKRVLGVAGPLLCIAGIFSGAAVLIPIGTVITILAGFFKSKKKKRTDATKNITRELRKCLSIAEEQHTTQYKRQLVKKIEIVRSGVLGYLGVIHLGVDQVVSAVAEAHAETAGATRSLNLLYARRVVAWVEGDEDLDLDPQEAAKIIRYVKREPGKRLLIKTIRKRRLIHRASELTDILQEQVTIKH